MINEDTLNSPGTYSYFWTDKYGLCLKRAEKIGIIHFEAHIFVVGCSFVFVAVVSRRSPGNKEIMCTVTISVLLALQ
jgi:hypothetical protein